MTYTLVASYMFDAIVRVPALLGYFWLVSRRCQQLPTMRSKIPKATGINEHYDRHDPCLIVLTCDVRTVLLSL